MRMYVCVYVYIHIQMYVSPPQRASAVWQHYFLAATRRMFVQHLTSELLCDTIRQL